LITYSSPTRVARVLTFLASDEAELTSVMAKAERMRPSRSGFSHFSFCSGVPTRSRTSMLPVSGAAQFITSDDIGFLPSSTAM
jgi:hypothetical protein